MRKLLAFNFFVLFFLIAGSSLCAQSATKDTIVKWKLADLQQAINNAEQPTIFIFWATFCKPCIEEIPHFEKLAEKYDSAGLQLVLVSLDMQEAYPRIMNFAAKRKFTSPIRFLDETNADLFCPAVDETWSGSIPASLFIHPKKDYRKFFEQSLSKKEIELEILQLMAH